MPATIHHFGWTTEETIIQEHCIGPLSVNYLKPEHDSPHRERGRATPPLTFQTLEGLSLAGTPTEGG